MSQVLWSAALVVIVVRLTRLAIVDHWPPAEAIRHWFVRTFATVDHRGKVIRDPKRWGRLAGAAYSIGYIWTCYWCMSIWVGGFVWAVAVWLPVVIWPAAVIAAGSMVAGWDGNLQGEHDKRYEAAERKSLGHQD
jgi:hypothetical protein